MKTWLPAVIASHLLFWIFWPLAVAVPAVAIVLSVRGNPRRIIPMMGLSPFLLVPVLFFGGGILKYAAGHASLMTYGLPEPEFNNLDREPRCRWSTSGCAVDGSEAFRHAPNNLAVRLMTRMFGVMPGAYRGAYPTRAEVVALVAQEPRRLTAREMWAALSAAGLSEKVGRSAFRANGMDPHWAVIDVQGEALIVAYPGEATLFEKATGRVIARYLSSPGGKGG